MTVTDDKVSSKDSGRRDAVTMTGASSSADDSTSTGDLENAVDDATATHAPMENTDARNTGRIADIDDLPAQSTRARHG